MFIGADRFRLKKAQRRGCRPFPNSTWRNAMQESLEIPLLVSLLGLPTGQRILEVGCGRGIALPALDLLCKPTRLAGIDIDGSLLDEAGKRLSAGNGQTELIQADVREIPFSEESFDIVIDFGTCYHITHHEMALSEITRVLSVGGIFVHETRVSQLLAHPMQFAGLRHSLSATPLLVPNRNALLWASWVK